MLLRIVPVGNLRTNCYIAIDDDTRGALVIDPGGNAERILRTLERTAARVECIVLTHSHYDHVLAAGEVRAHTGAPLAIHAAEAACLAMPPGLLPDLAPECLPALSADLLLTDNAVIAFGGLRAIVLHTPGHSPGSVSLWVPSEGVVFGGDLLFREGIGRTDLEGCSQVDLERSVRTRLFTLPPETVVCPGHGPSTTIAHERAHNPWFAD